jgi:uncharacterized membrane protein YgdD (TMEM256/DUF423 family)
MTAGQLWLFMGATFGGTGVMLGAFGAHALTARLTPAALDTWQTAVSYHLIHALALVALGIWLRIGLSEAGIPGPAEPGRLATLACVLFAAGIVLFSGSLYALALGGPRWLGPVTPLGGLAFIAGWVVLALAALRPATGA